MDWTIWVVQYGAWGLAAVSFLAATLVPVSSEIAVIAALKAGIAPWHVFVAASAGNAAGATLNYGLGLLFADRVEQQLSNRSGGRSALEWTHRYGKWSLFGSWLPVVGDPLCLTAGLFKISFLFFALVGIGTRLARYAILIHLF